MDIPEMLCGSSNEEVVAGGRMNPLEKLENAIFFQRSSEYYRIAGSGYLATIYSSIADSPDSCRRLWRVMIELGRHRVSLLKLALLTQLPQLAAVAREEHRVSCTQWQVVLGYLLDSDERIRKASHVVLLYFARNGLLTRDALEDSVCPAVEKACQAHPETVDLMCQLAGFVGKEATKRHFLMQFMNLCLHDRYEIRVMCSRGLPEIGRVFGAEETGNFLLPLFIQLCHDPVSQVRFACIDVFLAVACLSTPEKRHGELTSAFVGLLSDVCLGCSLAAYFSLGAFICTFADSRSTGFDYEKIQELLTIDRKEHLCGYPPPICNATLFSGFQTSLKKADPTKIFCEKYLTTLLSAVDADPVVAGFDSRSEGEEDESNSRELDEFNSFRFWQIPHMDITSVAEPEDDSDDWDTFERTWTVPNLVQRSSEYRSTSEIERCTTFRTTGDEEWRRENGITRECQCRSAFVSSNDAEAYAKSKKPVVRTTPQTQYRVPEILVERFARMVSYDSSVPETPKTETLWYLKRTQSCASWLPAVALTLRSSNWSCLRGTYEELSVHYHWKVRRTAASFIHELASMLGDEVTTKDLVPIFINFMSDSDTVRIAALRHLFEFLKVLSSEWRTPLLSKILEHLDRDSCQTWRVREELALQLKLSIKLFTTTECFNYFVPSASLLLSDEVASVRQESVNLMSDILVYLSEDSKFLSSLVNQLLREFAGHRSWRRRQTFVHLCSRLADDKVLDTEIFSTFLLSHLLKLSHDFVPNVQISVARCLSVSIIKNGYISSCRDVESIMKILDDLRHKTDRDVRYFASLHNAAED